MSDKPEYSQTERTSAVSNNRGFKRHCKRFWWIYVLIVIAIVVLVVPLVIFVGVKNMAQKKVNEAHLEIQGVKMLQTKSKAYLLEINSTITTSGGSSAEVESFDGELYLEDYDPHVSFTNVTFPQTNNNKHQVVNVSQEIDVTNLEAFSRFNTWFHNNESLRITVYGKPKVKVSGISHKYDVTFKKTVTIKGLNSFNGTEVTGGEISLEEDSEGHNFNGTVVIPNDSVFTLDIGNATFDQFVGDESVGALYINNLLLAPGDNAVNITATMNETAILAIISQKPYCETGIVPVKLLGKSVENDGEALSYFTTALGSTNQTVEMDIGAILKADLNYTVSCADS